MTGKEARRMSSLKSVSRFLLTMAVVLSLAPLALVVAVRAQSNAQDPGVRGGPAGAGGFISGLSKNQQGVEGTAQSTFIELNSVTGFGNGGTGNLGLGPRFNSNSCSSCHLQPAVGGSAPFTNGFFQIFDLNGALNEMPSFESQSGVMANARFPAVQSGNPYAIPAGFTQELFTITGRSDAGACDLQQPNFSQAQSGNNMINRIPQPMFGDGLMEIIPESQILSNQSAQCANEATTGICGVPNLAPDGTISRFGWKAQERSALIFSASAYNIEEGVSNAAFPNELDESNPACVINAVPEDRFNFINSQPHRFPGDPERLALFIRMLAAPAPGACPTGGNCVNGQTQFNNVGCTICHSSPGPGSGTSAFQFVTPASAIAALGGQKVNLFSDLLVHHMGNCLADGVIQGAAQGDMFRTAPLWGVGQRIFFLHDGRTSDIVQAIEDHSDQWCTGGIGMSGYPSSEANGVVAAFNALTTNNQQDLIDFLRSL
ncbi:MAG TPA: di-heme oxidoredictase family protein [Terriglobia bacterium]|nr:di-heme oxidoredictase family protein [Terriglobia bacterium]